MFDGVFVLNPVRSVVLTAAMVADGLVFRAAPEAVMLG
jgi:hypothetical protein